ncbi:hypothetical protein VRB09_12660 [Pseudomonas poae]|uniref:hypothetical protein n=1 Tax=Pseudomonas poae TaxID=200451 RepID=UPI0030CF7AAC
MSFVTYFVQREKKVTVALPKRPHPHKFRDALSQPKPFQNVWGGLASSPCLPHQPGTEKPGNTDAHLNCAGWIGVHSIESDIPASPKKANKKFEFNGNY